MKIIHQVDDQRTRPFPQLITIPINTYYIWGIVTLLTSAATTSSTSGFVCTSKKDLDCDEEKYRQVIMRIPANLADPVLVMPVRYLVGVEVRGWAIARHQLQSESQLDGQQVLSSAVEPIASLDCREPRRLAGEQHREHRQRKGPCCHMCSENPSSFGETT